MTRPAHAGDGGSDAGFTLLEMLLALTILGLVLAAGAAAVARRDLTPTPAQVARQIQAALLQARSEAIRTGADAAVVIDLAARSFAHPPGAAPVALPDGMVIRARTAAELVTRDGRALIVFRADGGASGAEIALSAPGAPGARIEVGWLTGLTRLSVAE